MRKIARYLNFVHLNVKVVSLGSQSNLFIYNRCLVQILVLGIGSILHVIID